MDAEGLLQKLLRMCEAREVHLRHHRARIAAECAKAESQGNTTASEYLRCRVQVLPSDVLFRQNCSISRPKKGPNKS